MTATIVQSTTELITLQITIPLSQSFLDTEETIQSVLNEAGTLASGEALKQFDTDGSANELPRRKRTGYQHQKRASCSSLCNWR